MAPDFSHDLFHSHIIPDLLSEYIHDLLVNSRAHEWNPFRTLPLVSRDFCDSCRTLCSGIFGRMDYEDNGITDVLDDAQELWSRANQPPTRALPVDYSTPGELKCNSSLLQVYVCVATAKSYFNLDVLWHLELEKKRLAGELDDADEDMGIQSQDEPDSSLPPPPLRRMFRMRDDNMHRVYLPLTCAIQLCDQVRPARLAYTIADYIANIIPYYSTAPVLLKYTQDLEGYVWGDRRLDNTLLYLMNQTLGLVDGTSWLLQGMQKSGKLVRSFTCSPSIPMQVLQEIRLLDVLDIVMDTDWGEDTRWINDYTKNVKMRLLSPR